MKNRKPLALISKVGLLSAVCLLAMPGSVLAETSPPVVVQNKDTSAQQLPFPDSAQIAIVPCLVARHACTLSVIDAGGKPLSGGTVLIDQSSYKTDSKGTVTFTVPDADSFEIALLGEARRKIGKRKFSKYVENVFAENDRTAEIASALMKISGADVRAPQVAYAPSVLVPGNRFVLVGCNLTEKIADEFVDIDGNNAVVLSASPDAILAVAPIKLNLGPLRELFVSVGGQTSNSSELDIGTPYFSCMKPRNSDKEEAAPEAGKIGMNGTNVPCLIRVKNLDLDNISLWSPKQEPLGKTNVLLTPGGEQNYLDIGVRSISPSAEPKIDLCLEQMISASGGDNQTPQLQNAACRAEIMRLARRKTSAEYRLEELRKKNASATSGATVAGVEQALAESKALSLRIERLSKMLASRRSIYQCFGNTDAQYRQALDDAAGGAMLTLDLSTKPVQIISDGGVSVASAIPLASSSEQAVKKGRPLRMLEPAIKLLPPMTEAQITEMNARNSAKGPDNAIGGAAPVNGNSDEPQLRPGLPEPEPGVSASLREKIGGGKEPQAKTDKTKAVAPAKPDTDGKAKSGKDSVKKKSSRQEKSHKTENAKLKGKQNKEESARKSKSSKHSRHSVRSTDDVTRSAGSTHKRHRGRRH